MSAPKGKNTRLVWYSIILCILVMWVHIHNLDIFFSNPKNWIVRIEDTEKFMLGAPAVAGFFVLSGFLLFKGFARQSAGRKLRVRVKSLLIPYLIWNFIYGLYAFVMANNSFLNRFADQKVVTPKMVLQGVLDCSMYNPIFWYIKYLMVFVLVSVVLGLVIRNRWWASLCLLLLLVINLNGISDKFPQELRIMSIWAIFFMGGIVLSLFPEIRTWFKAHDRMQTIVSFIVFVIFFIGYYHSSAIQWYLGYHISIAWAIWNITGFFGDKTPPKLLSDTFFLYASHWLIARNVNKLICVIFGTDMIWGMLSWIILPFIIVGITFVVKRICSGKLHPLWVVLNGGR